MKFHIQPSSSIFMHCSFDCSGGLQMGSNSTINSKCRLDTRGGILIGDNVSISQEVIILTADHDINSTTFEGRRRKVIIEDYVWIGTRAVILPGVTIGKGSVIAACSVVSKDVQAFSVVAGIPARLIKMRRAEFFDYNPYYRRLFQ